MSEWASEKAGESALKTPYAPDELRVIEPSTRELCQHFGLHIVKPEKEKKNPHKQKNGRCET